MRAGKSRRHFFGRVKELLCFRIWRFVIVVYISHCSCIGLICINNTYSYIHDKYVIYHSVYFIIYIYMYCIYYLWIYMIHFIHILSFIHLYCIQSSHCFAENSGRFSSRRSNGEAPSEQGTGGGGHRDGHCRGAHVLLMMRSMLVIHGGWWELRLIMMLFNICC